MSGGKPAKPVVVEAVEDTPSTLPYTFSPREGVDYLSSVTVGKDPNLVPGNIKKDVSIFGTVGTYDPEPEPQPTGSGFPMGAQLPMYSYMLTDLSLSYEDFSSYATLDTANTMPITNVVMPSIWYWVSYGSGEYGIGNGTMLTREATPTYLGTSTEIILDGEYNSMSGGWGNTAFQSGLGLSAGDTVEGTAMITVEGPYSSSTYRDNYVIAEFTATKKTVGATVVFEDVTIPPMHWGGSYVDVGCNIYLYPISIKTTRVN